MIDIRIDKVSKTYNPGLFKKNIRAVNNLSIDVKRGETLGLIGPNGAGKSTTIRMLLGLIRPDAGNILFRGMPLLHAPVQREIGYLPENPYLYDHLTLLEILKFSGQTSGLDASVIRIRGEELMERLDLLGAQKRPLRTFSKGMLQRAGICFALLHDPSIVVFDEPMSGLDPIGRKMVFDLVVDLKAQGKTIFFCSHILSDVERLCDRIGLLNKGRLVNQFHREEFVQNINRAVFLEISRLNSTQKEKLIRLGGKIRDEKQGHVVAISGDIYYQLVDSLREFGVEILGCRSEWMSLEDLFMQNIKGANT